MSKDEPKVPEAKPSTGGLRPEQQNGVVTAKTLRSGFTAADVEAIKRELDELTDDLDDFDA